MSQSTQPAERFAFAALVTAVLWPTAGIFMSAAALRKSKANGGAGRSVAIAGLWASTVGLLLQLALLLLPLLFIGDIIEWARMTLGR